MIRTKKSNLLNMTGHYIVETENKEETEYGFDEIGDDDDNEG